MIVRRLLRICIYTLVFGQGVPAMSDETRPTKSMVQFRYEGAPPSLEEVAERFHLKTSEIDDSFGIIVTDPEDRLATILVPNEVAEKLSKEFAEEGGPQGVFGDVRIEGFGPPEE
jgi:hypothetical protein